MRIAVALAFIIVAVSPLIGIWLGHVWAKASRLTLRTTTPSTEENSQAA